ncbi:MAG: esterase/lipase family protein [Planctomycetota bacterium]
MTPRPAHRGLLLLLILLVPATAGGLIGQPPDDVDTIRFELPLEDGRLPVRDLLVALAEELGVPAEKRLDAIDWSIDVDSALGRLQLHVLNRLAGGVLRTRVRGQQIEISFDRARWRETLDDAELSVETWLSQFVDRLPEAAPPSFGVRFLPRGAEPRRLDAVVAADEVPARLVLLVHGLDDPGWMWRDVIVAVQDEGYDVARFDYPNDGPIADAADLLAVHLADLKVAGVERVDIVAHSMGGLVTRDVLTRGAYYAGDGGGGQRLPAIDRLIMCGTPNHGSTMARLRGISELQEQISRLLDGNGWLGAATLDGSGEAGVDLLPDSVFLRRLNARPLADHTAYTIIAGRMSPVSEHAAESFVDGVARLAESDEAPDWLKRLAGSANGMAVRHLAGSAVRGLGDGCVSLDSARLDGVDDTVVVKANHVGMIVRVLESPDTPPAIPIILDRLARPQPSPDSNDEVDEQVTPDPIGR